VCHNLVRHVLKVYITLNSKVIISAVTETLSLQQFPAPDLTTGIAIVKSFPGNISVVASILIVNPPEVVECSCCGVFAILKFNILVL